MTETTLPENPLEQLIQLNAQGNYEAALEAVDALPDDLRDPLIDKEIARAYIGLTTEDDDDAQRVFGQVAQMLERAIEDAPGFQSDPDWLALTGTALARSTDGAAMARAYLQAALQVYPDDVPLSQSRATLESLLNEANAKVNSPLGIERPFAQRIAQFWAGFAQFERELYFDLQTARSEAERGAKLQALVGSLENVLPDVGFELTQEKVTNEKGETAPVFIIQLLSSGSKVRLAAIARFLAEAPETIDERWLFCAHSAANPNAFVVGPQERIHAGEVKAWLVEDARGQGTYALSLWSEKAMHVAATDGPYAEWLLNQLVLATLGEVRVMNTITTMTMLEMPRDEEPMRLTDVAAWLDNAAQTHGEELTVERCIAQKLQYHNQPNLALQAWRCDVTQGETHITELLSGYFSGDERLVNALWRSGIGAGFLAIDKEKAQAQQSDATLSTLERIGVALSSLPQALFMTGLAHGERYDYVDLLAWDLGGGLKALAQNLKDAGLVEGVYYVPMRANRQTTPLSDLLDGVVDSARAPSASLSQHP